MELIVSQSGALVRVQIDRPRSLNALTYEDLVQLRRQLQEWEEASSIHAILVMGQGDRAFSAGADVKSLYEAGLIGSERQVAGSFAERFFRTEYSLNAEIARFPKQYVSLWDGITMGGGVGISIHGNERLATAQTQWAMPETGIGLFPDVGATSFLSRLGPMGLLLGLTGISINGAAACTLGLATRYIDGSSVDAIAATLIDGDNPKWHQWTQPLPLDESWSRMRDIAETAFSKDSVANIRQALSVEAEDSGCGIASRCLQTLDSRSPTSLRVTFEAFQRAQGLTLEECLQMEFRLALRFMQSNDFFEGVRAALIDKDRQPRWQPNTIDDVAVSDVEPYFRPLENCAELFDES